jgi:hypothetical protein
LAAMSKTQQDILDLLAGARSIYDEFVDKQKQEMYDERWEALADTRRLVREARDVGVPYRQIGMALGTSDHTTIKDYEVNKRRAGQ